jgi:hypothetical protein
MEESSATALGARTMKTIQESKPNNSKSTPGLSFGSAAYLRDLITGRLRRRQKIDDFPHETRQRYKFKWDELRMKKREERGYIDGYQEGDSELDFSEWEDAKEERG